MTVVCLLLLSVVSVALATDTVYYVVPTFSSPCPVRNSFQCKTLDRAVRSAFFNPRANVKLILSPGTHELTEKIQVEIEKNSFFANSISVAIESSGPNTRVICKNAAHLSFEGLTELKIRGIEFLNCGVPSGFFHDKREKPLEVDSTDVVRVERCAFQNTMQDSYAYEIEIKDCLEILLTNSVFKHSVDLSGSKNKRNNATIANCTFQGKDGALKIDKIASADISSSTFSHSSASEYGGGLHIEDSTVSISNVAFRLNQAGACGALYTEDSIVSVSRTLFMQNAAQTHGAICAVKSELLVNYSTVVDNFATKSGTGGMFAVESNITLKDTVLSGNRGFDGGALNARYSLMQIEDVRFTDNTAQRSGGALRVNMSRASLNQVQFRNNTDQFGRAISAENSHIVTPGGECIERGGDFTCKLVRARTAQAVLSGECNSFEREVLNERKEKCVYKDTREIPTVGIGFNLKRGDARQRLDDVGADYDAVLSRRQCLSDWQIRQLFYPDMAEAVRCAERFVGANWGILGETRQSAVADMAFNLGCTRIHGFRNFRAALQRNPPNYWDAANEMEDSNWCRQVKSRCPRTVGCMRRGEHSLNNINRDI